MDGTVPCAWWTAPFRVPGCQQTEHQYQSLLPAAPAPDQTLKLVHPWSGDALLSNPQGRAAKRASVFLAVLTTEDPRSYFPIRHRKHLYLPIISQQPACCISPAVLLGESNPLKNPGRQPTEYPVGQLLALISSKGSIGGQPILSTTRPSLRLGKMLAAQAPQTMWPLQ